MDCRLPIVSLILLLALPVWAEDFVTYSGTTYLSCQSFGDTTIPLNDPNVLTDHKVGYVYANATCADVLPTVPAKYRKMVGDVPTEMTQAEQAAVDAPTPAEQQVQADTAALATLDAQLDADDTAWESLTVAQKLGVVKTLLRREALKKKLGKQQG